MPARKDLNIVHLSISESLKGMKTHIALYIYRHSQYHRLLPVLPRWRGYGSFLRKRPSKLRRRRRTTSRNITGCSSKVFVVRIPTASSAWLPATRVRLFPPVCGGISQVDRRLPDDGLDSRISRRFRSRYCSRLGSQDFRHRNFPGQNTRKLGSEDERNPHRQLFRPKSCTSNLLLGNMQFSYHSSIHPKIPFPTPDYNDSLAYDSLPRCGGSHLHSSRLLSSPLRADAHHTRALESIRSQSFIAADDQLRSHRFLPRRHLDRNCSM